MTGAFLPRLGTGSFEAAGWFDAGPGEGLMARASLLPRRPPPALELGQSRHPNSDRQDVIETKVAAPTAAPGHRPRDRKCAVAAAHRSACRWRPPADHPAVSGVAVVYRR